MLGSQPPVHSDRAPPAAPDERAREAAPSPSDPLRRLGQLAQALSACAGPEDVRRAAPALLEAIPARMARLVELRPGGAVATAAWPGAARVLPPGAEAAAPARRALAGGGPVWLEGEGIASTPELAAAAAALGLEAWGAVPLGGGAALELGLGAAPRLDATGRAFLAAAAGIVGGALLGASAAEAAAERERRALAACADTSATFEALAAGCVLVTPSGEILRMNRSAMDLLALDEPERDRLRTVQQLLAHLAVEWPDGSRVQMSETPFARARRGEAARDVMLRFVPRGQPCRWIQASAVPLAEPGAIDRIVITVVDVTRTRELEEEQRDLAREVFEQLTPPLRTVRERSQRLLEGAAKGPEEGTTLAREISRAARRMEAAMRELETALGVDSRALAASPELVDVKAFLLDLLERVGAEPGVERVIVSAPPGLRKAQVDPDHLERMLLELIGGALAGAAAGTEVLVSCEPAEGAVRITVASSGQDIAPEDLHRIFDRFFRARGRPAGRLYTVRLLAEANRGRVLAESGEGRGLAIHLELPTREG